MPAPKVAREPEVRVEETMAVVFAATPRLPVPTMFKACEMFVPAVINNPALFKLMTLAAAPRLRLELMATEPALM